MSAVGAAARSRWVPVLAIVVIGIVLRVELMRHYNDDAADLRAITSVSAVLTHHFLHAYRAVIPVRSGTAYSWTWPAGLFPLLMLDHVLVSAGASLRALVAVPNFVTDVAMSLLLYRSLAARGRYGAALVGCALVSFGWPFFLDTGVMNQFDSLCTFFALAAVMLWTPGDRRRSLLACVLLGIATSIKLPFGFLVLAFFPTCKDWREGVRVVGVVAGIPLLVTAPFLIADFHNVVRAVNSNHGLPGFAGWGLFVQPAFRHLWLDGQPVHQSGALQTLTHWEPEIVLAVLVPIGFLLWHRRVNAIRSAAVLSLAIWAANATPIPTYLVWLIPFVVLDEELWTAGLIEVAGFIPAIQLFLLAPHPTAGGLYVPIMAVLQAVIVVALVRSIVRIVREPGRFATRARAPDTAGLRSAPG